MVVMLVSPKSVFLVLTTPLRPNSYIQLSILHFLLMPNEHLKYNKSNPEILIHLSLKSDPLQYSSTQLISNYSQLKSRTQL